MTPAQAADALFTVIPRQISPEILAGYGIEGAEAQAEEVTREVLSLNLYWIWAAIEAHIARDYRAVLFDRLMVLIHQGWTSDWNQSVRAWTEYLDEWEQRRMAYVPIGMAQGGEFAVASRAAAILEDNQVVREEDRAKILALLVDYVPIERYGAILADGS